MIPNVIPQTLLRFISSRSMSRPAKNIMNNNPIRLKKLISGVICRIFSSPGPIRVPVIISPAICGNLSLLHSDGMNRTSDRTTKLIQMLSVIGNSC